MSKTYLLINIDEIADKIIAEHEYNKELEKLLREEMPEPNNPEKESEEEYLDEETYIYKGREEDD